MNLNKRRDSERSSSSPRPCEALCRGFPTSRAAWATLRDRSRFRALDNSAIVFRPSTGQARNSTFARKKITTYVSAARPEHFTFSRSLTEESNLPAMVPLLPLRFRRGVDRVPLAWTRRLPRPPQLHHLFQAVQTLHHGNPPFKKKADASDPSYRSPSLAGAQAIGEARFSGGYCMWTGPSRPRCSRARALPGAIGASSRCRRSLPGPGERPRVAATPDWGHRKVCS